MKIVFRLNYHTAPGQSIWLKYAIVLGASGVRFDQMAALHWINDQQWETSVDIKGAGELRLEYSYQLRQPGNGVELDEWLSPRVAEFDPAKEDALLLLDSWCSAGTVDYALETNAFKAVLPARGPFEKKVTPVKGLRTFRRSRPVPIRTHRRRAPSPRCRRHRPRRSRRQFARNSLAALPIVQSQKRGAGEARGERSDALMCNYQFV